MTVPLTAPPPQALEIPGSRLARPMQDRSDVAGLGLGQCVRVEDPRSCTHAAVT